MISVDLFWKYFIIASILFCAKKHCNGFGGRRPEPALGHPRAPAAASLHGPMAAVSSRAATRKLSARTAVQATTCRQASVLVWAATCSFDRRLGRVCRCDSRRMSMCASRQKSSAAVSPKPPGAGRRWFNDEFQSERPLVVLSLGATPWVLQYSQLASRQSGSITFPFLSQA